MTGLQISEVWLLCVQTLWTLFQTDWCINGNFKTERVIIVKRGGVLIVIQWGVLTVKQWGVLIVKQWGVLIVTQWGVLIVKQWGF